MSYEIFDIIHIGRLQNTDNYDQLNAIDIEISDNEIISTLTKYKKYKYRFLLTGLFFSSSFTTDTNIIFVTCNGLNQAKKH